MKPTAREQFNFYRSYFDVFNKIPDDKDKLAFINAILNKQFLNEDPKDLDFVVELSYESQRHAIEKSVKGWIRVKKTDMQGNPISNPPSLPPSLPPSDPKEVEVEVEEEEEVKEEVKEEGEYTPKDEDLKNELSVKPHLRNGFNPVSNDNQFNKHTFVAWFNESLNYIGFNGALKSLSNEDNDKLNILIDKGYTIQDFKIAFKNFQGSTFYKEKGHITTKQFLKGDTFDRFLIMGDSKPKQTKGGDVTQW